MNYSTAIFLIDDKVRAISGTYEAGGNPAVFKTLDPDIKVGDIVVVPSSTRHNFTTFKVSEVDVFVDYDSPNKMEWVAGRVDLDAYRKVVAREDQIIPVVKSAEQRKRRDELKAAISMDQEEIAKLTAIDAPSA